MPPRSCERPSEEILRNLSGRQPYLPPNPHDFPPKTGLERFLEREPPELALDLERGPRGAEAESLARARFRHRTVLGGERGLEKGRRSGPFEDPGELGPQGLGALGVELEHLHLELLGAA